jgi:hypothetical protein
MRVNVDNLLTSCAILVALVTCLPVSTRVGLTLTLAVRSRKPGYATPFDGQYQA